MSEFLLIIIWFGIMKILSQMIQTKQCEYVHGRREIREKMTVAIFLFVPIFYMVTMRSYSIGDTGAYVNMFRNIPNTMSEFSSYLTTVNKDKGFTFFSGVIKILVGNNVTIYFFVLALIQGISLIYIYRKYSVDYLMSMFLFIVSTDYISWMYNGMRQFTAVTIIFAATPLMLKKKWISMIAVILFASTIHGSALIMLPIIFITQGQAWNKRSIMFTVACIIVLLYADKFTNILDIMLSETQYTNVVSDWKSINDDGTNIIRVLVYSIPALLSFVGRRRIAYENDVCINLCTNMSIVSAAIYLVSSGTSGIYMGRLPIYTSLYGYILLPYLLKHMFTEDSEKKMKLLMVGAYLLFYFYQIHVAWNLI